MQMKPGTLYCAGEPEYFGAMPVRTEITVLPADPEPTIEDEIFIRDNELRKRPSGGWTITESTGIGVINPRGIEKLKIINGK